MNNQEYINLVKELFPEFANSTITVKKGSPNGVPLLIENGDVKYWVKIPVSRFQDDSLRDVEQQALKEINSDFVVKLLGIKSKTISGKAYEALLFPYIEGEDLDQKLLKAKSENVPFTEVEVLKLINDITSGISSIWKKGWVHQDIKPKNIRYDDANKRYVLLDLGIAHDTNSFNFSSGNHPKDYLSPEQLRASTIGEKVAITFSSDIFQLGTIAYELLTLRHPFKYPDPNKINGASLSRGRYPPIVAFNKKVTGQTIEVIKTMLNPHSGYRFNSPEHLLSVLKKQTYKQPSRFDEGLYFLPWPGPQGYKNILDYKAKAPVKGIILPASHIPSEDFLKNIIELKMKIIYDPETFLLDSRIEPSWHGDLTKQSWFSYPINDSFFNDGLRTKGFVVGVINTELSANSAYIIPPYFNINNLDSEWWEINRLLYHEALKYIRRVGVQLPIIAAISVSENIITVEESRKKLVDYYSQFADVSAFYLRVDSGNTNSTTIIKSIICLIKELQFHKPVILADADLVVFGYLSQGLSSLSIAFADSKRVHDLDNKTNAKPTGGNYKEKLFIPALMDFVKVEGDLEAIVKIFGADILCNCEVCSNVNMNPASMRGKDIQKEIAKWSKLDRSNHFLCCLSEWKEKISKLSTEEKNNAYKEILDRSKKIYEGQKGNVVFTQILKNKDYEDWEKGFFPK